MSTDEEWQPTKMIYYEDMSKDELLKAAIDLNTERADLQAELEQHKKFPSVKHQNCGGIIYQKPSGQKECNKCGAIFNLLRA